MAPAATAAPVRAHPNGALALALAALLWPVVLAAAVDVQQHGTRPEWTGVVYLIGSAICHQRPERSFHTAGVQWPVCARCLGLYVSAPIGALLGLIGLRSRRPLRAPSPVWLLAWTALPTAGTLALEWGGLMQPGNAGRALAALPLGAAIGFVLVRTVNGTEQAIG